MSYKRSAIVNDSLVEILIPKSNVLLGNIFADSFEEATQNTSLQYTRNTINGIGPDFWLEDNTLAELKNVKHFIYTLSTFKDSVYSRFQVADDDEGSKHKLLVISKEECLSNPAVHKFIAEHRIHVISLGYQLRSKAGRQYRKAVHLLTKKLKALLRLFTTTAVDVAVGDVCVGVVSVCCLIDLALSPYYSDFFVGKSGSDCVLSG